MAEQRGPSAPNAIWAPVQRCATIGVVLLAAFRATVAGERTPVWEFDPWSQFIPMTGIGPGTGALLDAVGVALATLAVWAAGARGHTVRFGWCVAAGMGAAGVWAHAWMGGPHWLEPLAPAGAGGAWIGAMCTLVACAHAARDRWLHRVTLGLAIGVIGMLVAKGAVQVLIEHPQTVATYRVDRAAILESRGWSPDSAAARGFERRLMQSEATGWFGLSNVFASFGAAAFVGLGVGALGAWRANRGIVRTWAWRVVVLGAVFGALALWMSGSKGGVGAAAVGGTAIGFAWWLGARTESRRWASLIGPGVVLVVLGLVGARGVVGTSVGELSMLFRAFYIETALRIWAGAPLLGVGPGGFQDAYMLAKPAISPEAVSSPHSVLFDWVSTLGIAGAAYGAVLLACASRVAPAVRSAHTQRIRHAVRDGIDPKAVFLLVGVTVLVGALVERRQATPDQALLRAVGLGVWVAVAWGVARLCAGHVNVGRLIAAGAGLVLLAHAQIEMTMTQPESGGLACVLIGLAVGPPGRSAPTRWRRSAAWLGGALLGWSMVPLVAAGLALLTWQGSLLRAAEPFERLAVARLAGTESRSQFVSALRDAEQPLVSALATRPGHEPTGKALARVQALLGRATEDVSAVERSVETSRALADALQDSGSAQGWFGLAATQAAASGLADGTTSEAWRSDGLAALERAAALDPHGVAPAMALLNALVEAGRDADARSWAAEVLRRDGLTNLDPLVGLSDRERRRVRRLAASEGP
jgi:hypothetical protein